VCSSDLQGRTVSVEPLDSGYRTPAVVQSFVRDTMQLLFSATGSMPGEKGMVADPGVEISTANGKARISSLAHLALFSLSADFHPAILSVLAERTPQEIFTRSGRTQLILDIRDVSEPIPISGLQDSWEVSVIANKVILQDGSIVSLTPFNRTVLVHSIDFPDMKNHSTPVERQIADIRKSGLEIYEIKPYISSTQRQLKSQTDSFITPVPEQNTN